MGAFLFAIGLIGFFFLDIFFSKKKISRKKINIGIIAAFASMVCGVIISPPDTEQTTTQSTTIQSTTISFIIKDTSSESKEKDEKKVQSQLEAKKKLEEQKANKEAEISKKTASAETILAQAEANPTRENYSSALSAIQAIPGGNQALSDRLASVDSTIKANEAAQAEAAKIAEQEQQAQEQSNQQTVYVTATGSKYHSHKCGNGNYTPTTLEDAQAQGLTPCEKCFGN